MYHEITGSLENVFRSFDTRFRYLKAGFSCVDNGFLRGRDNASSCSMIPLSFEVCDSDPPTTLEGFIKKMALDSFEPGRRPSTALPAAGSCRLVLPQREARHDRRASLLGRGAAARLFRTARSGLRRRRGRLRSASGLIRAARRWDGRCLGRGIGTILLLSIH